mmetsp:Transcript_34733/g.83874  ORF Transcript_34733/g.83874 Transcript_34733/m.83874 type:complete len:230 (+) Transcript_34733:3-692(+)
MREGRREKRCLRAMMKASLLLMLAVHLALLDLADAQDLPVQVGTCRKVSTQVDVGTCSGMRVEASLCQTAVMRNFTEEELAEGVSSVMEVATNGCNLEVTALCAELGPGVVPAPTSCDSGGGLCNSFVGGLRALECFSDADCTPEGDLVRTAVRAPCCQGSKDLINQLCRGVDQTQLDLAITQQKDRGLCTDPPNSCYMASSAPPPPAPAVIWGLLLTTATVVWAMQVT